MIITDAQKEVIRRCNINYINAPLKYLDILNDSMWARHRCFIIGGGESLRGFDFSLLDNDYTIGINKSFMYYDSTILFFSDCNYYSTEILANKDRWNSLKSIKVSVVSSEENQSYNDVYVIRRSNKLNLPNSLNDGINVWNNSGFGALVLAYLLGANPIYLLGYDLKCVNYTHWHNGYNQNIHDQNARMHSFAMPFVCTADQFKQKGVYVVNLNPDSALPCFHKIPIEKVLN